MKKEAAVREKNAPAAADYGCLIEGIGGLLEVARNTSARAVNAVMTATCWEIGRRVVEFEQGGMQRAEYGKSLLLKLSRDLSVKFGKGFSPDNHESMRLFYQAFARLKNSETVSRNFSPQSSSLVISETVSRKSRKSSDDSVSVPSETFVSDLRQLANAFPLPWSSYVQLVRNSRSPEAMDFYHTEALRGGWSVRQLRRQMDSGFYERTALSRDKAAMLAKADKVQPGDRLSADEEIKDPLVLEFLGLKDEYSESDLEEGLIHHLEHFLLELGNDFSFVARQRRLRIDDEWFRVDLLLFHRRLRCLVIVDLKLGRFTHADAGQMHVYLNYAREHWTLEGENPPVGIILCAGKGKALVHYATDNLPNKVLVREYLTALPGESTLAAEITAARRRLEADK
jgi:predicted nuclease of restriction endonuclease-like (RecB) superfamily